MAPKCEYLERCTGCYEIIARGTNKGVAVNSSACTCKDDGPVDDRPQSPPRTIPWRSATLVSADGKIKWFCNTIFLALQADVWHDNTIHESVIERDKYYWLDETWGIGNSKGCDSYDAAAQAQLEYGKRL